MMSETTKSLLFFFAFFDSFKKVGASCPFLAKEQGQMKSLITIGQAVMGKIFNQIITQSGS